MQSVKRTEVLICRGPGVQHVGHAVGAHEYAVSGCMRGGWVPDGCNAGRSCTQEAHARCLSTAMPWPLPFIH